MYIVATPLVCLRGSRETQTQKRNQFSGVIKSIQVKIYLSLYLDLYMVNSDKQERLRIVQLYTFVLHLKEYVIIRVQIVLHLSWQYPDVFLSSNRNIHVVRITGYEGPELISSP